DLIGLRDEYAHYSSLNEYLNFWLPSKLTGQGGLKGIVDFHKPTIVVAGKLTEALEYMLMVKSRLKEFQRDFLRLCEFTPGRRPKHYLKCECGYVFAEKEGPNTSARRLTLMSEHLEIEIKDRVLDYGVIGCPACGVKTETDLQFWRDEGFSLSDQ
ncbi:MAG: hypothetical protein M3371_00965, partial [Acidobacteriota bacterium]|nr:hypothetical protein [Acidobacteriota bacterium]